MKLLWIIALATLCHGQSTGPPEIVTISERFLQDEKQIQYLPPLENTNQNYIQYQNQYVQNNPQLPIEMQNAYNPQSYQYLPTYQEQYGGQPVQENVDRQYVSPIYVEPEQYTTLSPIVMNPEPIYTEGLSQSTRRFDIQPQPMFNQNQTYYSYMYKHPDYQENQTNYHDNYVQNSHSYIQQNQQPYEPQTYTQREYRPIQRQNTQNTQNQPYQQQNYQNENFNQTSYSYMYQPAVEYTTMKPMYGNNYVQQDKSYSAPSKMDWGSKPSYNASKWNQKDFYSADFPNQVLDAMKSNQAQTKVNYNNPVYGERIIPQPPLYAMSRSSSVPVVNIPSTNGEKAEKTAESILQPTKYIPQAPSQFKPQMAFDAGTNQYAQQYLRPYQQQGPSTTTEGVPILKQMAEMEADGSFHYETLTGDQTHIVQQGHIENLGTDNEEQVMQGSYSFVGDDGRVYTVNYIADANGFRATGDHLPTAPPMPEAIQRSIEANLAQEAAEEAARLSQPYNQFDNQIPYTNQQINDLSRPSQQYAQYSNNQLTYAAPDQPQQPQPQQQQQPIQPQPQAKERSSFVRY